MFEVADELSSRNACSGSSTPLCCFNVSAVDSSAVHDRWLTDTLLLERTFRPAVGCVLAFAAISFEIVRTWS